MDKDGNIVDSGGKIVFPANTLDYEYRKAKRGFGTIP
jgi:hypothetical protein